MVKIGFCNSSSYTVKLYTSNNEGKLYSHISVVRKNMQEMNFMKHMT